MNNTDIENNILYGIVSDNSIALDFSKYDSNLFLNTESRILAKCFIDYTRIYKTHPTKSTLLDIHKETPELCELIEEFFNQTISIDLADYKYNLEKLKENYKNYKYNELKEVNNIQNIDCGLNKTQYILNEIKSLEKTSLFTRKTLKQNNYNFKEQYRAKLNNPELGIGILTGLSYLDYIKNGLMSEDLFILAGESGSGKSMFLNNIAINIWKQQNTIDTNPENFTKGYNVCYISLEMGFDACYQRTITALADVNNYHIRDSKLTKEESIRVGKACKFIQNFPYEFDILDVPRGCNIQQLEILLDQIKTEYCPDVIFIDYLGLMNGGNKNNDDWLRQGEIAAEVHEFTRVHQIPVVSAVQLNRIDPAKVKGQEYKEIGLHRIGRSSLIAHHASLIVQIKSDQDLDEFNYYVIKNRHGELGKHTIRKNFANSKIIDMLYDPQNQQDFTIAEDISTDISDILGISEDE